MEQRIEVYFDGAVEPINPGGHGAWGGLVKIDGQTVWAGSGYMGFGPHVSNNAAEYSGVIAGIQFLLDHDVQGAVTIRGDSKLVVMQLRGEWQARSGLYLPLYEQARDLLAKLPQPVAFEWIRRDANTACDELSKKVLLDHGVVFRLQPNSPGGRVQPSA